MEKTLAPKKTLSCDFRAKRERKPAPKQGCKHINNNLYS
jgi:hypothetical protein